MSQGKQASSEHDARSFQLQSERSGADERIRLLGEMDLSVTGAVDREMRRAEASDATKIVLDLDELEFLDASGIRLLLNLNARSRADGGRLRITRSPATQVRRVLELTGVGDVLPFVD